MADRRFIEDMRSSTEHATKKSVQPPKVGVRRVVELSKYERPSRDTIDAPEPVRRSYDSI